MQDNKGKISMKIWKKSIFRQKMAGNKVNYIETSDNITILILEYKSNSKVVEYIYMFWIIIMYIELDNIHL